MQHCTNVGASRETSRIFACQIRKLFFRDVRQVRVVRVSREPPPTRNLEWGRVSCYNKAVFVSVVMSLKAGEQGQKFGVFLLDLATERR